MKNGLIKIVFAGLLTLGLTFIYTLLQYFYHGIRNDIYIELGFPYEFYYFTPNFEVHGLNAIHFIYDSFLLFVFSFLVIHIGMNIRKKRKSKTANDFIDERIQSE